jgi:hypothetical protein
MGSGSGNKHRVRFRQVFDKEEFLRTNTQTRRTLGGGALADLILWRNPLRTAAMFVAGLELMWLVLWSPTSLVTLVSKALLWLFGATFVAHLVSVVSSL